MKTDDLRAAYLDFFEGKGCVRRPSDVLVPKDDPTVLFTPAGMNQFKAEFLGLGKPDFKSAVTSQKCLRTGDIENVGVTARHHTFFEMLGNFSFGDYFKREAILWAWEFLTSKQWLGMNPDELNVTVYEDDDEAAAIWANEVGLEEVRIRRHGEHDNFWPAGAPTNGPDGVCGPCSEIFHHPGGFDPSKEGTEIWNLVFTQFERKGAPPNNLTPLPAKNIDTGMGLERTAAVLQGVKANFEIDTLRPLCEAAAAAVGVDYSYDAQTGRPVRRIADHARAVTMAIHEGVRPGNSMAEYVVKQLLRRASLEGYLLGRTEPFLHSLVQPVVDSLKVAYPELTQTVASTVDTVKAEEERFLSTVERGIKRFDRAVEAAQKRGENAIDGEAAWELHGTYGVLVEMTEALAARHNLSVDRAKFEELRAAHEETSGRGAFADSVMASGPIDAVKKEHGETEFLGYEQTEADATILGVIAQGRLVPTLDEVGHAEPVGVILDRTPFYAEAGGQVGDLGLLSSGTGASGEMRFRVTDTQKEGGLTVHLGHLEAGELTAGATVHAAVDADRRAAIRRAHSATHLLHHALHETIGKDATQRGSVVEPDRLRFDFAHRQAVTPAELEAIEDRINLRVMEGSPIETNVMDLEEAKTLGAMMLFGEKYPDRVRVVNAGGYSIEFCGGTHATNTGQLGLCRIVSEESVGTGVRRITAVTGPRAIREAREAGTVLKQATELLKAGKPEELPGRLTALQEELKEARKQLAAATAKSAAGGAEELLEKAETIALPDGTTAKIVAHDLNGAPREALRTLADTLRKKGEAAGAPVAAILGTVVDDKVALLAAVSPALVKLGVKAGDAVKAAAKEVGGGGGGRPDLAEAGGKRPEGVADALAAGAAVFRTRLAP
ncbi:alanine--tRNA ligase [Alienimonas sp. DA493]|uniref:alanine--tRNA ligase n=1 Tax=Alienimonas sp. DA493 TaxID=3373605 RepID=UPI003754B71E